MRCSARWLRSLVVGLSFSTLFGTSVLAQSGTATLIGEVTDPQKQVVPGASVTLTNKQTGVSQSTVSDTRGGFRFVSMPPGRYDLKVELSGFKTSITQSIPLTVDSTVRQIAILELGGIAETVSVVSQTITLNTTDASLGNAISKRKMSCNSSACSRARCSSRSTPTPTRRILATGRWRDRAPISRT
jgi:hypothetical protein